MKPIQSGDPAIIIRGALGDKGPNVGKQVIVGKLQGEHSQHGRIWRVHGKNLVTEYGATGTECDCAAAWLQKIEPPPVDAPSASKEVTA